MIVASRAEAWIETDPSPQTVYDRPSPPARRRGLKQAELVVRGQQTGSPPARRRGLKLVHRST